MKILNRVGLLSSFIIGLSATVLAADFPNKEIEIIVNYGAGGSVDRTARSVQKYLPQALGQNIVVKNVKGAGGRLGIEAFMKTKRDGYTILTSFAPATTFVATTAPDIYQLKDLAIINLQWIDPAVLLVRKDTGWKTLDDMIKAVKAAPNKYTFGSSGKTSVGHVLAMDLFKKLGLKVRVVPYQGGGKTRAAFIGGEVQMTAAGIQGALKAKKVSVPVALFWDEKVKVWPEAVPVNSVLKGVNAEIGGAYRFHAVHADVKKNHPERFKALVEAFRKTTAENSEFIAFSEKTKTGKDWRGPEKSTEILERVESSFSKMFK